MSICLCMYCTCMYYVLCTFLLQSSPLDHGCISQRFMQGTILALVIVMAFRYVFYERGKSSAGINSDDVFTSFLCPQRYFDVSAVHAHSSPQRRRHRKRWVCSFIGAEIITVKIICFQLSNNPSKSIPASFSYVSSCVLYISWMPIFTATVTVCPPVCKWYSISSNISFFPV